MVLLGSFGLQSTGLAQAAQTLASPAPLAPAAAVPAVALSGPRPTPVPGPRRGVAPPSKFRLGGTTVAATAAGPASALGAMPLAMATRAAVSNLEHTFPAGWSLASVPLHPENAAASAVFDELPTPLRLYDYVGGHTVRADQPGARNVAPGRAFWILLASPTTVRASGDLVATGSAYRIPLSPGWNAIATPWLFAVDWTDVQVSVRNGAATMPLAAAAAEGWIDPVLEVPDPAGGYATVLPNSSPAGQLLAWRGYLLYAHVSGELVLAPPPADTTPPDAELTGIPDGMTVTAPIDISGSVGDTNLVEWRLEYVSADGGAPVVLGRGGGPVSGGVLGTFDPTVLLNGIYDIRLVAVDAAGTTSTVTRSVVVAGELKVGNFTVSFLDLEVPVAGLPISVTRTYDSRDKRRGDFGIGWRVQLANLQISRNVPAGRDWNGTRSGGLFPNYCLQPARSHLVTVTFPDGKVHEFEAVTDPQCQLLFPVQDATVSYRARPGTVSTLAPLDGGSVLVLGSWPGPMQLVDWSTLEVYDPQAFRLTMPDGISFVLHRQAGLQSITDANGNRLTVGAGGIVHSSGLGLAFTRDGLGRITAITDPAGHSLTYAYDADGDLVAVTDRESNTTSYTYDAAHGLLSIEDPRGVRPIRNEYDESGRILRHTDPFGKTIEYTHDVAGRQEVVVDRLGRARVFEYDERGKIVREIGPDGGVTSRTFDARGNRLTETDPLGRTTTYTYDAQDNVLSVADPLGNVVQRSYNARGQILTTTDARGGITTNVFDPNGNLASTTDADGKVTSYTSDARGNVLTQTDPLGGVSRYAYDAVGNLVREEDPLGHATTYTYDAAGNRLTQTRTRTVGAATETLTWTFVYDRVGRLVETTEPGGATTSTTYDSVGKRTASVDRLGRTTTYEYDDLARLVKTTYPDGTTEQHTYDAEGRRLSGTDRAGRTTAYEYDALGRLTRTTSPDGTFTAETHDAAGQVVSVRDAAGNVRTQEYDAAGRRIKGTDALGKVTTFAYDQGGNLLSVQDARGHTTAHEYDALNRRTRTVFPDGTDKRTAYDALSRTVAETDQAGRTTLFTYDAAGRLTRVTDALGQITSFVYDSLGNRLSQTGAHGQATTFEYDVMGRITRRTLPGGAFEVMAHDEGGNLTSRTDFNGHTMTYAYDLNDRLLARSYPDGTSVQFTYTPSGRRATARDARGTTVYGYDLRDRLASLTYPDGRKLSYAYDGHGNRTSLAAQVGTSTLTTSYAYDAGNRLRTLTDPAGRAYVHQYDDNGNRAALAYPNGVATSYAYDALNRLTAVSTAGPAGIVQSHAYTLGAAGQRTQVSEADATTRSYTYDALYRLTRETVLGGAAPYEKAFSYDAVGNRLTQTTMGSGGGAASYTYDERDRLLTAGAVTYSYDANGNLVTTSGEGTFLWDFDDRLRRFVKADGTVVEHAYDADGNRVRTETTAPAGVPVVTNYLVDPAGPLSHVVAESDGAGTLTAYYVRGDDLLAVVRPSGTRFYHADGLGSIRALTDESGDPTDTYSFTAFGELLDHTGPDPSAYLFAGEPLDPNSGFYYNRARWMDPRTGRFVSMDSHPGVAADPASLHKYLYAEADPVNHVDPTGLFSIGSMVMTSAIIGSLAGALTGYIAGGWKGAVAGAISGLILSPLIALGVVGSGYFLAAAAGISVTTGLAVSGGTATALFGLLGIREYLNATTEREKAAAAVALAIMIASLGTARAMAPRRVTILGSRRDTGALEKVPGFNVLNVPDEVWTEGLNRGWLQSAINRNDVIMLRTDPQAFAALMRSKGTSSVFLNLEMPMLQSQGFVEVGPFMVRW